MNIPEISLDNGKAQGKVTVCKEANEKNGVSLDNGILCARVHNVRAMVALDLARSQVEYAL